MSVMRVGSNKRYAQGWEAAFAGSGRKTKKSAAGAKQSASRKAKSAKQAGGRKKAAKKKSSR